MLFIKSVIKKTIEYDVLGISAQVGFYLMFSVFPFLLFLVSLIPFFDIDVTDVIEYINLFVPVEIASYIESFITDLFYNASTGVVSLSLLLTLYSASTAIHCILQVIDRIFNQKITRSFLKSRAFSLLIVLLVMSITIVYLLANSLSFSHTLIYRLINYDLTPLIIILKLLILPLMLVIIIFTILLVGPNRKIGYRFTFLATLFTSLGLYLNTYLFEFYITHFASYNIKYGTVGVIITMMLWLYLIGFTISFTTIITKSALEKPHFDKITSLLRIKTK